MGPTAVAALLKQSAALHLTKIKRISDADCMRSKLGAENSNAAEVGAAPETPNGFSNFQLGS